MSELTIWTTSTARSVSTWELRGFWWEPLAEQSPYGSATSTDPVWYRVPDDWGAKQAARAQRIAESLEATVVYSMEHAREPATDGPPILFAVPRPSLRRTATAVRNWRKAS
jgi:hypothetical protein